MSAPAARLTCGAASGHIRRMAVPAALGLFCNTLFNITDTFYAGKLATAAQAALTFAFPLYFLLLSACVGLLQTIAARVAAAIGGGRLTQARRIAGQGMVWAAALCIVVWLILLPLSDSLLSLLGARGQIHEWANDYTRVIFIGAPAFIFAFALNGVLHGMGNTAAFRNSTIAAAVANVFLDPMLMFGWFGLPKLGMAGIGWATIIAQGGGALYLFYVLSRSEMARRWRGRFLLPQPTILLPLARATVAPTGRMLFINAGFFIITAFVGYFSAAAVAGYGIALRLEQLFLLPTIGLEAAMIAYCGQNFGAQKPARVRAAYYICFRYGVLLMAGGAFIMIIGGEFLVGLFNSDETVVAEGRRYLWLAAISGPLYVIFNIAGAVFLSAGRHQLILIINGLRLIIAPTILSYLLAVWAGFGVGGVWLSLFLCNATAALVAHQKCGREMAKRIALTKKRY